MPVYWNNSLYISGSDDILRAFVVHDGRVHPAPWSASKDTCDYPGCGLSLSANGDHDGILWALKVAGANVILKAYDARDLGRVLYDSDQHHGRDTPGGALKFIVPTIADGKVFVGGSRQLTVFGLDTRP